MKRIFLVDTENIGNRELPGAEHLTKEDRIILFHNEGAQILKLVQSIAEKPAAVEIVKMNIHQKNAMDFQICTYLGLLVAQNKAEAEYYIVSKDHGYLSAIEFVKANAGKDVVISEVVSISLKQHGEDAREQIDAILTGYPRKARHTVKEGIRRTQSLSEFHNFLQNALPKDGQNIYKVLRNQYSELRYAFN